MCSKIGICTALVSALAFTAVPAAQRWDDLPPAKTRAVLPATPCETDARPVIIDALGVVPAGALTAGYVIAESGHYALDRDLVVPDGVDVGILIAAEDVSLSLRGHTIAEPRGVATVIRGERNSISICNGRVEGGADGISIAGDFTSDVEIVGVSIAEGEGGSRPGRGLVAEHLWTLRLQESRVIAEDTGVSLVDVRHATIIGNTIRSGRAGLLGPRSGNISENTIEAPLALSARKSIIRLNSFIGRGEGGGDLSCAVRLEEENIFEENFVTARNGSGLCAGSSNIISRNTLSSTGRPLPAHLLLAEGSANLVNDNRFGEARLSSIELAGGGNRVIGNLVFTHDVGIGVDSSHNLIEGNLFRGRPDCGIDFRQSNGNIYRGNTGKAFGICGLPNVKIEADLSARGPLALAQPRRRAAEKKRSLPDPDAVTLISELDYAETGEGRVGLLIDTPGHYLLTRSLTALDVGVGALITAPDVVLDLGGHTLKADQSGDVVRALNPHDFTLRNGVLDSGNGDGLSIDGDPAEPGSRLTLERMRIHSGGSCATGVFVRNVGHIDISSSILGSNYGGVTVFGTTTGRIVDSVISTSEHGLRITDFRGGEVTGNLLVGGHGDQPAEIRGAGNLLAGNIIATRDEISLLINSSNDVIASNTIIAGAGSAVWVRGQRNLMDDNLIVGGDCGMEFEGSDHSYRRNVVLGAATGVCGQSANDAGENVLPPWGCGDGVRSGDEVCDGDDPLTFCTDLGFDGGVLRCAPACDGWDTSDCSACGDGVRSPYEQCEGADLGGQTCLTRGFYSGSLACTDQCTFDTSGCAGLCGDGIRQDPEFCDEWDLSGRSCASLWIGWGTLRCTPGCDAYDFSECN